MSGVPGDPLEGLPFARSRAVERFEELMFGAIRLEELAEQELAQVVPAATVH